MLKKNIYRRNLLKSSVAWLGGLVLTACSPSLPDSLQQKTETPTVSPSISRKADEVNRPIQTATTVPPKKNVLATATAQATSTKKPEATNTPVPTETETGPVLENLCTGFDQLFVDVLSGGEYVDGTKNINPACVVAWEDIQNGALVNSVLSIEGGLSDRTVPIMYLIKEYGLSSSYPTGSDVLFSKLERGKSYLDGEEDISSPEKDNLSKRYIKPGGFVISVTPEGAKALVVAYNTPKGVWQLAYDADQFLKTKNGFRRCSNYFNENRLGELMIYLKLYDDTDDRLMGVEYIGKYARNRPFETDNAWTAVDELNKGKVFLAKINSK